MPRKSGTTISPPGTLLTDLRIFMGAYSTCAEVEKKTESPPPAIAALRHMGVWLLLDGLPYIDKFVFFHLAAGPC